MKVAVVIERIETWRGGAETSTLEFAHLLAGRGLDVTLFTATRAVSPPDLQIVTVPVTATPRPLKTARFLSKTALRIRQQTFDIIHAITPIPIADVYQPRGGLIRETVARNVAMRPDQARRTFKRFLAALNIKQRTLLDLENRVMLPSGPAIACVSEYVARQVRAHYRLDGDRVRVIFNGVQIAPASDEQRAADRRSIRERHRVPASALLLLCVAHNFKLKGVGPLLHAVARLADGGFRDLRLLVVGRDNPGPMAELARRLGVADLVTFVGPTERVAAFYHAADACVHPTYYDPCSRVVLEALSRGVPCITTSHNGAAEVMLDGVHGFIVSDPDDTATLADRVLRMRDPGLIATMSSAASALAPKLTMTRHVDEMIEFYETILASRRSAAAGNAVSRSP